MKKLIIAFLIAASSSSAFAYHPDDSDFVDNIGVGATFVADKDINIKPNSLSINGKWVSGAGECHVSLKKSEAFDQVLKKGTVFKVTKTRSSYDLAQNRYSFLEIDNPKVSEIACSRNVTIGVLKQSFENLFLVKLADPIEF